MRPDPDDAVPAGSVTPGDTPGHRLAYQPALDGVRALAIVAVLFYHGSVSFHGRPVTVAQGGFLGVEVFFVLSGFLITSLLVTEFAGRGTVALGRFWARRARRLLPALFCVVAAVGFYQAVAGTSAAVPDLLADGLATLFYVGNWHQILDRCGLLRPDRPAVAAAAHLVARHRGAVLPGLAARRPWRPSSFWPLAA